MLTIRFNRVGKRNKAYFRVVLQEHTIAPGGRHVEVLGSWDPHMKKAVLKADKIKEWIGKGAQVSDTAYNLFVKEGIIEGKKRTVKMKKPEKPAEEAPKESAETKEGEVKTEETKEEMKSQENDAKKEGTEAKTEA